MASRRGKRGPQQSGGHVSRLWSAAAFKCSSAHRPAMTSSLLPLSLPLSTGEVGAVEPLHRAGQRMTGGHQCKGQHALAHGRCSVSE